MARTWSQTDAHQLISVEPLFTAQTANRSVIGILRNVAWNFDGWFHELLERRNSGAARSWAWHSSL
jgi:hypothetical protein